MGPFFVVVFEVNVEVSLRLLDAFLPLGSPLDTEVLIEQGALQSLHVTVALWTANSGGSVLDAFQLKEQLIGGAILAAAEFSTVIAENGCDLGLVLLEEGKHIVVQDMDGGDGQLGGIEPAPSITAEAVDDGLKVNAANALQ